MKKIFNGLFLSLFVLALSANCSIATDFAKSLQSNKLMLSDPSSVAEKANSSGSLQGSGGAFQDPMTMGVMNGYFNMMQGMTGGSYNPQEMQKQQADFAKQQFDSK